MTTAMPPQQPLDPKQEAELKKTLDQLKIKLDKFKKKLLDKHKKDIAGISLLPPEQLPQQDYQYLSAKEKDALKHKIDLLVAIHDGDREEKNRIPFIEKLAKDISGYAESIDKNLKPQTLYVSEIKELCYDSKYELIRRISYGNAIYDPKDFLGALKITEIHKTMVLKKFEKYVASYIAVGSLFRGDARSEDIDVAIVIDDTDVKRMNRIELRDKLGAIIRSMGFEASQLSGVKKSFHMQIYILTDFWDSIKESSPVIFTFLRDGVPLYDKGIFMSWKLLLQMGRIKPSPEAIDMHMDVGVRLIDRAYGRLLSVVGEDMYYATLNPSQAALMMYGLAPSTPKETIKLMYETFCKKEKILEEKYVKTLEKTIKYFKDIEHGTVKKVTGKEVDAMFAEVDVFLKRIKKLFTQIETRAKKKTIDEMYQNTMHAVDDMLQVDEIKLGTEKGFKKLVSSGKFSKRYLETFKKIQGMKQKNLNKHEIEKLRRENSAFMRAMLEYVQRKRGMELERAKIRVKYGDKFGEVYLLGEVAYMIEDVDSVKKAITKAPIQPNGGIGKIKDSSVHELEEAIVAGKIPKKVFIKERIFEDLRKLYGKDVEIMINY
tara:strand:- start:1203 stop:3008 length:1806 start_codon:yes stop_codon:yes gene_type:complete